MRHFWTVLRTKGIFVLFQISSPLVVKYFLNDKCSTLSYQYISEYLVIHCCRSFGSTRSIFHVICIGKKE